MAKYAVIIPLEYVTDQNKQCAEYQIIEKFKEIYLLGQLNNLIPSNYIHHSHNEAERVKIIEINPLVQKLMES